MRQQLILGIVDANLGFSGECVAVDGYGERDAHRSQIAVGHPIIAKLQKGSLDPISDDDPGAGPIAFRVAGKAAIGLETAEDAIGVEGHAMVQNGRADGFQMPGTHHRMAGSAGRERVLRQGAVRRGGAQPAERGHQRVDKISSLHMRPFPSVAPHPV
ncbi:MAG TPA: hypothetical protein VFV38_18665 [Ktedonobacteraceae bacterium]|nr:hypothetical protein [Ktedonobacteraceae bacterium]